ncbi:uncharacterized protein LOC114370475 [Glycine soja]|uniref:uncharacterized protein n=1 Tax=Glycine max TaxID=3847 RepID=UPI0003DEA08C|nr:uncharacterized protein LOC100805198 [Glycine max]XP_028183638.1 uncharacterized protein LOC114370475 [Glycine soja]|eukprot:XP_025979784.1 uncharacterized protein LOC100805198 [Glycine max]
MGQLAQDKAERPTRTFGANTEKNPKEECKAVLTRGQKKAQEEGKVEEEDRTEEDRTEIPEGRIEEEEKVASPPTTKSQKAREARKEEPPALPQDLPYPVVPTKKNKERYFKRFLEIFKGLEITMPFREALQQMPLYSKFMKDILTKKGKYIDNENIVVGGNCSAIIQRKLPKKFKDPGSVTIPCTIGKETVNKALIDLGASINLMPLSMCKRIGNLKIDPTKMTLQLADRSITRPYGVVEDVLVKVRHFTFPVDFVIMDIEEDTDIPLILGRPFMLTSNCVVDMGNGNLELSIDNQKITFDLFKAMKYLQEGWKCFRVEEIDKEDVSILETPQSSLEKAMVNALDCLTSEEEKDLKACLEDLDRQDSIPEGEAKFETLEEKVPSEKKKVELKILPDHLKYVFLEEDKPVVISNALTTEEENRLVDILKKHREAIG